MIVVVVNMTEARNEVELEAKQQQTTRATYPKSQVAVKFECVAYKN